MSRRGYTMPPSATFRVIGASINCRIRLSRQRAVSRALNASGMRAILLRV